MVERYKSRFLIFSYEVTILVNDVVSSENKPRKTWSRRGF